MQRNTLLLLAVAALASSVTAQIPPGLLYWCSFVEGGQNFVQNPTYARTNYAGYLTGSPGPYSQPCHFTQGAVAPQLSDNTAYVYSNGSAYPYTDVSYKISPSSCLVSGRESYRPFLFFRP